MPIGDNRNVVTDTNGSVLDPLYQQPSPAQPRPQDILSGIGQGLGIQDAMSAMTGQMTPEEAQMFALGSVPMLLAPEAKVMEEAVEPITQGIRAFHGSPHDFPAFSMESVGTGQGAQSYGHGLYFAEEPKVAEDYRRSLAGTKLMLDNRAPFPAEDDALAMVLRSLSTSTIDKMRTDTGLDLTPEIIEGAKRYVKQFPPLGRGKQFDTQTMLDYVDSLADKNIRYQQQGKMYEVNIKADPEHFIDYDKPVGEQSKKVKDALLEAVKKEAYGRALASTSKQRADELWAMVKDPTKAPAGFAQELLKKPEFTEQMRQAGVPGIKYLDQGSRVRADPKEAESMRTQLKNMKQALTSEMEGTDRHRMLSEAIPVIEANLKKAEGLKPTYNYVVFDDKLIDIVKKYGIGALIAGGASNWSPPNDK